MSGSPFARRATIAALSLAVVGASGSVFAATAQADPTGSQVVINEVYGGGGNAGSHYQADFVELYNPSASAVDLTGWTVQYRSATGTSPSGSGRIVASDRTWRG